MKQKFTLTLQKMLVNNQLTRVGQSSVTTKIISD